MAPAPPIKNVQGAAASSEAAISNLLNLINIFIRRLIKPLPAVVLGAALEYRKTLAK